MNEERFCPTVARAILQSALWLTVALIGVAGCTRIEPAQQSNSPDVIQAAVPKRAPETDRVSVPLPPPPQLPGEGSGVTAWAREFKGELIAGLDGSLYEPYVTTTIERVQKALRERGLYAGPVNGVLDRPTMKSIYAFQEANYNLQRCGVPTPRTRKMLAQGSHTDLS